MTDTDDDGLARPRHRRRGRASKRGTGLPGRHLRLVTEDDVVPRVYPAGAYPVEDLAAMSHSALEMLLHRATIEAESGVAPFPHLVITRDTASGDVTYSGPFPSGMAALTMARDFVEKYRDLDPRWEYTLTVAPQL